MANELSSTWDSISNNWDKWGQPLRPSLEDAIHMISGLLAWYRARPQSDAVINVFLLGVTPELVNMTWPFATKITAMDYSQGMIDKVWPGNVADKRVAVLGDWFTNHLATQSQDIVLADGSYVFYGPASCKQLSSIVSNTLKPGGLFVARHFIQPKKKEVVDELMKALQDGYVTNFHSFKFRVAMALQKDFTTGVTQGDVYDAIIPAAAIIKTKFSQAALDALSVYQGKNNRLFFPTAAELKSILGQKFSSVKFIYPGYHFGQCCPTVIAQ